MASAFKKNTVLDVFLHWWKWLSCFSLSTSIDTASLILPSHQLFV